VDLTAAEDAPALPEDVGERLREAFERGTGHGLLQLGAGEVGAALPAVFSCWRELGSMFVTALCHLRRRGTAASADDTRSLG
jgi:non-specific serine/threonine protein kinase